MKLNYESAARYAFLATFAAGLILIFGSSQSESTRQTHMQASTTPSSSTATTSSAPRAGARAPWPEIPFTEAEVGTLPPGLPVMHKLLIDVEASCSTQSPTHGPLVERFQILVRQNVVPEVGERLDGTLSRHEIIYSMSTNMQGAAASFSEEDGVAILSLNAMTMANIHDPATVINYMLVIEHEFTHYLQWKKAADPIDRETFRRIEHRTLTPRTCHALWQHEREAYHQQCVRVNAYGLDWQIPDPPNGHLCPRVNVPAAFDRSFFHVLSESASEATRAFCDDFWWDLAGGPRVAP